MATRRLHVTEWRLRFDRMQGRDQFAFGELRESAQQHRAIRHRLFRRPEIANAFKQVRGQMAWAHFASWKITPTVWRWPERIRLTPWRRLTR